MGGKIWEVLQKEAEATLKSVKDRAEYFQAGANQVRELLLNNFIKQAPNDLLEAAQESQEVFDFNKVRAPLQKCLIDEVELGQLAEQMHTEGRIQWQSLASALDVQVLSCGIPLKIDEQGYYQLALEKPFTPKAQDFMRQFVHVLNLYRTNIHLYEYYNWVINASFLDTTAEWTCLSKAEALRDQLLGCTNQAQFHALLEQTKTAKKEIEYFMSLVNPQAHGFAQTYESVGPELNKLLERGAQKLKDCYIEFPNDSKIYWMFCDTDWHSLLKTIAKHLSFNEAIASSYQGSLTIPETALTKLGNEFNNFYGKAIAEYLDFKLALLTDALNILNDLRTSIKADAARNGFSLKATTTHSNKNHTMYALMTEAMRSQSLFKTKTSSSYIQGFSQDDESNVSAEVGNSLTNSQ